jgi:hypothetical protein
MRSSDVRQMHYKVGSAILGLCLFRPQAQITGAHEQMLNPLTHMDGMYRR